MKTALAWLTLLVLVALQVTVGSSFGVLFALPLVAIFLVVLSAFLQLEQLLYMALVSGLLLDFASGRTFGLNLSFMLFVVLFGKLVLRLGRSQQNWVTLVILNSILIVLYNFLLFTGVFNFGELTELSRYLSQLGLQLLYGIACTVALYWLTNAIMQSQFAANPTLFKWLKK